MKLSKFKEKTKEFTQKISNSKKKYLDSRKESDFEIKTKLIIKRIFVVLKKNYYVATRNPKLYVSLILAPLLFVILIGMAFNTSQLRSDLKIGIYDESPEQIIYSAFSEIKDIEALNAQTKENCVQSTMDKDYAVCIAILQQEKTYDVDIYFDYSRMSIYPTAYTLVREAFSKFEQEMMIALLNELREKVNPENFGFETIQTDLKNTEDELINASEKINSLVQSLSSDSAFYEYKLTEIIEELTLLEMQILIHQELIEDYRTELNKQRKEADETYTKLSNVQKNIENLTKICANEGNDLSDDIDKVEFLELVNNEQNPGCSAIKTMDGTINTYVDSFKNIKDGLDRADKDLQEVYDSLELLKQSNKNYIVELENEREQITQTEEFYSSEIELFKNNLLDHSKKVVEYSELVDELNIEVSDFHLALNPREIVQKFEQNIKLISETRNMLDYTLHLIIPFILLLSSLLLSITLNRNEYKTSAFQRNKMLKNNLLIFSGNTLFILIIMLLEMLFILFLFKIFFGSNTLINLPIILVSASIFILFWTILGFIISRNINSDEGAIFSGTILGLIMFFLSDVMVPVESFPKIMLYLYKINPFVYFSEIIRSNYLIGGINNLFNSNFNFLLIMFILILCTGLYLVWRDLNENNA
ncbi:MAG: ABC transporter permease [Candidatus Woesearchaeota archaeon]